MKEGLGVIKLRVQNEALSLKNLHKFFNKADLSWVQLIWAQYYQNGKVPSQIAKSSFWWRGMLRLLAQYIGLAYGVVGSGHTFEKIFGMGKCWNTHTQNSSPLP
jgi:hypothetical protein